MASIAKDHGKTRDLEKPKAAVSGKLTHLLFSRLERLTRALSQDFSAALALLLESGNPVFPFHPSSSKFLPKLDWHRHGLDFDIESEPSTLSVSFENPSFSEILLPFFFLSCMENKHA